MITAKKKSQISKTCYSKNVAALKRISSRKSNCCVEVVTLKHEMLFRSAYCEEVGSPKMLLSWKSTRKEDARRGTVIRDCHSLICLKTLH